MNRPVIVLFTDFGAHDLYVGQVKAALLRHAPPDVAIIDLLHEVPDFDIRAGAHLLAALQAQFDPGTVFLCVVDPGVGGARAPAVMRADDKWYVGPDNGLLSIVAARGHKAEHWRVKWQPDNLSVSFHGRDLFAPVAARLAGGTLPADELEAISARRSEFDPDDLPAIIYIDHFGNAITGLRARGLPHSARLTAGGAILPYARTFSAAPAGQAFWYENSIGLVEIAANRASAAASLGLRIGEAIALVMQPLQAG